ncbi:MULTISPECIES: phage major capsid protein [Mycobacterium]|uniref:Phage capsid-like C-terminal domain-containing protein n=1 Tax=Mycobacterium kiyosense TaxID=2871094 RepID=A0A9P3Q532_9MYCO|nr:MULTISPECIES: phage major capsid protein [Mycobacterium]BDB43316.1 hypothetical protein IWGMT90018_37620 [Mycobacterium kiyosense]BDE13512.1 hypothetical protein MKCMC460_23720 [Mycobacterium sp. 20KCMC460]GLB84150.1 hypothetical protein SRL2020028_34060 [Mycobacterium kiyosense]GLB88445.1 hypothetical protein SRL2020130_12620 [Mycobacterium kiyosense]GLB94630.1 hypothetical protein SRL2020226_14060 [Mycobacterium kiyosense]
MNQFRDQLRKRVHDLAQKAIDEGRDFTPSEKKIVDDALAALKAYDAGAAKTSDIMGQLDAMAAEAGGDCGGTGGKFLSFGKSWSAKAASGLGQKGLATGSPVFVDTELTATPIPMNRPATSLLNILPVKKHGQPAYRYLRQSVRSNAAAVVAEGAVKPTSTYTIVPIDGSLSVIAHLSEGVPRYWFVDATELKTFVEHELAYGIQTAVESKVLADINGTSGIQTQAYATSPLVTLRKSLTKLEALGFSPAGIVLHPLDWESVELQVASTNAIEHMSLPYDAASRRLFGVPVVVANVEASGTGHVLATGAVGVDTDTSGVALQWSEVSNATDFSTNTVRARCEGRFGTSVYQPLGVVKATLTSS